MVTIARLLLDMLLMILLCLDTAHLLIKHLAFDGGMRGNVQFFGAVLLCPLLGLAKKRFADSAISHVLRNMNVG